MKVEFLPDLTDGGKYKQVVSEQLVRLYDFDYKEAIKFGQQLQKRIVDEHLPLDITALAFIEPINCKLIFAISEADEGITTENGFSFICNLTTVAYKHMIYLLEPFCDKNYNGSGYQWLYDLDTPIDLLFSPGGTW